MFHLTNLFKRKCAPPHVVWLFVALFALCSNTGLANTDESQTELIMTWEGEGPKFDNAYYSGGKYHWDGFWDVEENVKLYPPKKGSDGAYHVSRPEQLGYLSWIINKMKKDTYGDYQDYLSATIVLDNDIDMGAHYWERVRPSLTFSGTINGNGHVISGLHCVNGPNKMANHGGSMFGNAGNGAIFKNLIFYHCYSEGNEYTSIIVASSTGDITFDNVHLVKCMASSCHYLKTGGLLGGTSDTREAAIKITNCSSDVQMVDVGMRTGGFFGQLQSDKGLLYMDNCLSRTKDNGYFSNNTHFYDTRHAGFGGGLFGNMVCDVNNSAAFTGTHEENLLSSVDNVPVGAAFFSDLGPNSGDDVTLRANGLFVDNAGFNDAGFQPWRFAMGATDANKRQGVNNLSPEIKSLNTTREDMFLTVAHLNDKGMRLGVRKIEEEYYAWPLADSVGKVVTYPMVETCYNDTLSGELYCSEDLTDDAVVKDKTGLKRAYFSCGKWAKYKVVPTKGFLDWWVIDDITPTMTNKKRIDAHTFTGTPTASGKHTFELKETPYCYWSERKYSVSRQTATLAWTVAKTTDMDTWKDKGAYFLIYRNNELVDSVKFRSDKTYSWTDKAPRTGSVNHYEIKVNCPKVFYTPADNDSYLRCDINCSGIATITTSVTDAAGNLKVNVNVPNSKAFNGCKVAVRKYMLDAEGTFTPHDTTATVLDVKTFAYKPETADSTITLTFTDETTAIPCVKWIYEPQCYGFTEDSEAAGKTLWGNIAELLPSKNVSIKAFTASKGESTSKINLVWKTQKTPVGAVVKYVLSRKLYQRGEDRLTAEADTNDWKEVYTVTTSNAEVTYSDEALPGYVYKYRLKAHPSCDNSYAYNVYTSATDIGYAASRGTVMGRICYSGNTAVQGVDVRLCSEEGLFKQKGGSYTLYFDGQLSELPLATGMGEKFWNGDWTLSFFMMPAKPDTMTRLLTLPGRFALSYDYDRLYLGGIDACLTLPQPTTYNHVLLRHNKKDGTVSIGYAADDTRNDSVVHWTATIADKVLKATLPQDCSSIADTLLFGRGYRGYLDEVRLWDTQLSDAQIENTYNRYLSGNEDNLAAYYTFDSGVAEYAYDTSHPSGKWNNRHTKFTSVGHPEVTDINTIADDILTYRGITDKNGEYQISGIPFTGEGSNYQVVPMMGTHKFSPASTRRYVSQQSLTHSNVDFTDESSFVVPIQAYYVYGDIPVEGLSVSVDDAGQTDSEYQPIQTDKNGKATINVPIGRHRVSLSASKHTMANKGYACSVEVTTDNGKCKVIPVTADNYIDFQDDRTAPLVFYDSTMVRVVGRVAGGKDEAAKPVGFAKGLGNLGTYNISLTPGTKGLLNNSGREKLLIEPDTAVSINSQAYYYKDHVMVTTDPATGEYIAMLPPVKWTVDSVKAKTDGEADIDLQRLGNLMSLDATNELADTLWNDDTNHDATADGTYTTFKYNTRKDFIRYNKPKLTILNINGQQEEADSLMLGERLMAVSYVEEKSNKSVSDTIALWKTDHPHDGTNEAYALGHPLFISSNKYKLRLKLMETYENHDNKAKSLVPVRGAEINISNKLANVMAEKLSTGDYVILDTLTQEKDYTNAGIVDYQFEAGLPNSVGDHTLPITISYTVNGTSYSHTFNGYVTGGFTTGDGNNFVTAGPNIVTGVLCDPPGTGSSAYISEGSSMKASLVFRTTNTTTLDSHTKSDAGITILVNAVVGNFLKKLTGYEATALTDKTFSTSIGGVAGFNRDVTYTMNSKLQTGSDFLHVGAMGDVYFGTSYNIIFSKSRFVNFQETSSNADTSTVTSMAGRKYCLKSYDALGNYMKEDANFNFSQYDIIYTQIPKIKSMRASLVPESHYVDKLPDTTDPSYGEKNRYTYYVLNSSRDKDLWLDAVDYCTIAPTDDNFDGIVTDSVLMCNQWINNWQMAIAATEKKKYEMFKDKTKKHYSKAAETYVDFDYGFLGNVTYDAGGAPLSNSFSVSDSYMIALGSDFGFNFKYTTGAKIKGNIGITSHEYEITGTLETKTSASTTNNDTDSKSVTVGYNIADSNVGDEFSVDIYLDGEEKELNNGARNVFVPGSYLFCTTAGQSRFPWEKPQKSLFFKDGKIVKDWQAGVTYYTGNPVTLDGGTESLDKPSIHFSQRELNNVPCGTAATVKMTVANTSNAYVKSIDFPYHLWDKNADNKGIMARIDGKPINGYDLILPPGETLERTITFEQTDPNVLDYDDLVYQLRYLESAYDTISIHFRPMAPKITMKSNDGFKVNGNAAPKIKMTIEGYDTNYSRFAGVRLQYRKKDAHDDWHTQATLLNDSALYVGAYGQLPEAWGKLTKDKDFMTFDMSDLDDGDYEVRAQTFTILGNEELNDYSEVIDILKDTSKPELFGLPKPLSGFYTPNDEISLTFTEAIDADKASDANFTVTAAVNDAPVNHKTGLYFDGNAPAHTTSRVNIMGQSCQLAMWYKPELNKRSCLLSQDIVNNNGKKTPLKIWYNADATMSVEAFGNTYTSEKMAGADGVPDKDWMYLIFQFDRENTKLTLYNGFGTCDVKQSKFIDEQLDEALLLSDDEASVDLYVGGSADGNNCFAATEGLVIYDGLVSVEKAYSDKDNKHTDNLRGIAAYWPMDEGYETKAADKVRSRDLTLSGLYDWYVPYDNYALHLNGKDQCVIINTEKAGIGKQDDYVLEMLFRTAEAKHMTIFSNGSGKEGSYEEPSDLEDRLSIAITENGAIELNVAGNTSVMAGAKPYNDNKWHHISFNVHRDGYAKLSVDTIDISSDRLITGKSIGAFSNSRMTIGALRYRNADADQFTTEDFFSGDIDEVRIWNAYRTATTVNRNLLRSLNGNEAGLVAYYPFERFDIISNTKVTIPSIEDRVTDKEYHDALPEMVGFTATDSAAVAKEATMKTISGLKPNDVESPIAIEPVFSKEQPAKVVLKFADNVKMSALQGCIVNFNAHDLRDQAGNYMKQPVAWSLYVDARDVRWDTDKLSMTHQIGQTDGYGEYYTTISNRSSSMANWKITNVPSWLEVSQTSGTMTPSGYQSIVIRSKDSNPIGQYTCVLYLASDNGVEDKLEVSLTVTGERPDWHDEVDNASDDWMTVMARLKIGNQWSTDENSLVGAFDVNGICHGVASPKYDKTMDTHFVNMVVKGNMPDSCKDIYFKVWDSHTGFIYTKTYVTDATSRADHLPFIQGKICGTFGQPCTIETSDEVQQVISLKNGWNWVSNWISPTTDNINEMFHLGEGVVTAIKRRTENGTNTKFNPSESYHIYAVKDTDIVLEGSIIRPDTVTIEFVKPTDAGKGTWSWISYPESTVMTLDEAFADFKPTVNEVVKSQSGMSMYNGTTWSGSITHLTPGEGYLYHHLGTGEKWHYPVKRVITSAKTASKHMAAQALSAPLRFAYDWHRFNSNMVMAASLHVNGRATANWQVGAFIDGECRGWQVSDSTGNVYLTISGDSASMVTYRACNTLTGEVIAISQKHMYGVNDILGSTTQPYLLEAETAKHYSFPDGLPYQYEDYTYVTAFVLDNDDALYGHDYELAAFFNGECRGTATAKGGSPCPIAIYGTNSETYTFKLWDKETQQETELIGTKLYDATTPVQNITLRLSDATGINATESKSTHHWTDVGGFHYGKKPAKSGVYLKDHQKVVIRK